jgi:hypothetical protein
MNLQIKTKNGTDGVTITNLDRHTVDYKTFILEQQWYKITVPGTRYSVTDVLIDDESIRHCINAGVMTDSGYELWIHGDLSQLFSRVSDRIAQDDLLRFRDLRSKYLITESWNETVTGDFISNSVRNFFAQGEGPNWFHKDDLLSLPYVKYSGSEVDTNININQDLTYIDTKFYGQAKCRSFKAQPVLPTIKLDAIKDTILRNALTQFGFTEILQMQYVELQPNSVLPVHKDDFTYESGRDIIRGPTQLYWVLSGDTDKIKFKFKNVGLIDTSQPIFINNKDFVHSLVYTGDVPRGVFLAYGIRSI